MTTLFCEAPVKQRHPAVIDRPLTIVDIATALGISPRKVRELVKRQMLPAPIRLGWRTHRWPSNTLSKLRPAS